MIPRFTKLKRTRVKRSDKARSRAALIKELDKLCSTLVIARDRACVRCGGTKGLMSAHVLPKGMYPRLRFELYNLMTMDYACHLGNRGWHKDPLGSREWFHSNYPGRYDDLVVMAATAPKVDLKSLVICLRAEVRALDIEG